MTGVVYLSDNLAEGGGSSRLIADQNAQAKDDHGFFRTYRVNSPRSLYLQWP